MVQNMIGVINMKKVIGICIMLILLSGCFETAGFIAMSRVFDSIVWVDKNRNGDCPVLRPDGSIEISKEDWDFETNMPKNHNCWEWRKIKETPYDPTNDNDAWLQQVG